ncbi:MAG: 23S rRNA (pseudouridine(1915)-N(3))-methyltransferase RlmH [Eubacterium sp.]|nr:23S rRNA (pseudouridine(1915)-N(3))-methyltransferase RlmH [Eubacterium sp.]
MNIEIICVGKIKEKFFRDAIDEYSKRLSRYCKLNISEVADEKTPDNLSENERDLIIAKEGERIEKILAKHDSSQSYIISLEIKGKSYSSEELASSIDNLSIKGISTIIFVIGGSLGLDKKISNMAKLHLSFSKMTFPHQLMRVILLEQIYRSYRIIKNEPYHK